MSNATDRQVDTGALFTQEYPLDGGVYIDEDGYLVLKDEDGTVVLSGQGGAGAVVALRLAFTGAAATSGVFASLANPFGQTVYIEDVRLIITTQSTGASTLDIGVAANATTSSDTLIDGFSGAALARTSNLIAATAGTNGGIDRSWGATEFVNIAEASGDVDALVGYLIINVRIATT